MNKWLKDKIAIVTGSGRGIGRAIAMAMAKEGAKVIVNDIDSEVAETVAREITDQGGQALAFIGDIANYKVARSLVQSSVDKFGGLHILINNAGVIGAKSIFEMTEADLDRILTVNLKSYFNCIRHACRIMKEQKWGRIVNTTSRARLGAVHHSNYGAAKAGVVGLTKGVAMDVGVYGITCNCYEPRAYTRLNRLGKQAVARWRPAYEAGIITKEFYEERTQVENAKKKPVEAIPPFLIYLCTDAAANINGQVFTNGGGTISIFQEEVKSTIVKKLEEGFWTLDELVEMVPNKLLKGIDTQVHPH